MLLNEIHDIVSEYDTTIPDFSIQDGVLEVKAKDRISLGNTTVAVIDTSKTSEEYLASEDYQMVTKYDNRIIINSDKILYENFYGPYSEIVFSKDFSTFDKASLYDLLNSFEDSLSLRILTVFVMFSGIFLFVFFVKLMEVVFLSIFASLVAFIFRIKI